MKKKYKRLENGVEDLTNEHFGELTVIKFCQKDKHGMAIWTCKCSCGIVKNIAARHLKSRATISCGHINRQKSAQRIRERSTTHGASHEPWFVNWQSMVNRATHPDAYHKKYYNHERIKGKPSKYSITNVVR